jgi:hypothetical protein
MLSLRTFDEEVIDDVAPAGVAQRRNLTCRKNIKVGLTKTLKPRQLGSKVECRSIWANVVAIHSLSINSVCSKRKA